MCITNLAQEKLMNGLGGWYWGTECLKLTMILLGCQINKYICIPNAKRYNCSYIPVNFTVTHIAELALQPLLTVNFQDSIPQGCCLKFSLSSLWQDTSQVYFFVRMTGKYALMLSVSWLNILHKCIVNILNYPMITCRSSYAMYVALHSLQSMYSAAR